MQSLPVSSNKSGHSPLTFPIKLLPFVDLPLTRCLLGYFSHHSVQTLNDCVRKSQEISFRNIQTSPSVTNIHATVKGTEIPSSLILMLDVNYN